ncbi:DUF6161 domain-containing protein [Bradyrhizobium sp. CCBAU 51745]|uniref:DUF6161 domain-containing protein n=1 Tax=Bradyrhizobium sp. CCBAU 51745 TaxID=1325099 RepID=UPI002305578D|nr:DUF6161 domain-containing protein [Bradyrhizobium sp. CCBAU 51745]
MAEHLQPFLTIDRPFRSIIVLATKADAVAFVEREAKLWSWITERANHNYAQINNVTSRYRPDNWVQNFKNALTDRTNDQFENLVRRRYSNDECLCALDLETLAIQSLAQIDEIIAVVALATLHGEAPISDVNFTRDARNRLGIAHGMSLLAGIDPSILTGTRNELQNTRETIELENQRMRALIETSKADARKSAETIDAAAHALGVAHETAFTEAERARVEAFGVLRDELESTLKAFEIHMELQGPVTYWRKRAQQYRRGSNWALLFVLLFLIIAVAGLYYLYDIAAAHFPADATSIPYAALFRASAFALLMTSIAFWVGRVLLRIYFSARHLATDAEERRTMITTFLALTKKSAVKDDDRKFVLAALFRPGADGIVSDEAAPDTMFAALMGSILKK